MSLVKSLGRKKGRGAGLQLKKRTKRNTASEQELVASTDLPACADEQALDESPEINPDAIRAEAFDLSNSLTPVAAADEDESSVQPDPNADDSTLFDIVDTPISTYRPEAVAETFEPKKELVDPSKWFEYNVADSSGERAEEKQIAVSEECSSDLASASVPEVTSDDRIAIDLSASVDSYADEVDKEAIDAAADQARERAQRERRRHQREDSSDLVWVEYLNASMECESREAARTENVGAGGMRVGVKTAPSDLEKVIVRYPYRGFESCAIVRSRYQGNNGQEHLCLQFVDREWKISAACSPEESTVDQVKPRKILLADDDAAFRKILGNILSRAGYEVILAEDGESAVRKATSENPDLVITDGLMPKLHGFQVCKAVKALTPQPKVIMLTAVYTSPNYMWEARSKFGADDIMTKPCEIADLLRKIENCLPPVMATNAFIAEPFADTDSLGESTVP